MILGSNFHWAFISRKIKGNLVLSSSVFCLSSDTMSITAEYWKLECLVEAELLCVILNTENYKRCLSPLLHAWIYFCYIQILIIFSRVLYNAIGLARTWEHLTVLVMDSQSDKIAFEGHSFWCFGSKSNADNMDTCIEAVYISHCPKYVGTKDISLSAFLL